MRTFIAFLLMVTLSSAVPSEDCPKGREEMMTLTKKMINNTKELPPYLSVTKGVNKFGRLLFNYLKKSTNLVFSPYSLSTALAMLTPGARGDTLKQVVSLYIQEETLPEMLAPFQRPNFYPAGALRHRLLGEPSIINF